MVIGAALRLVGRTVSVAFAAMSVEELVVIGSFSSRPAQAGSRCPKIASD